MADEGNDDRRRVSRRNVVIRAFAFAGVSIGGSGLLLDPLLRTTGAPAFPHLFGKELPELGRIFLFRNSKTISGIPGTGFPFHREEIHPHNRIAISTVIERLGFLEELREIRPLDTTLIKGDSALFGGPTNNIHARILLGDGEAASPLFAIAGGSHVPAVRFDLSSLDRLIQVGVEQELWPLWIENRRIEHPGELLLITSIPDPYQSHARLLSLASNLGPGMFAIDLLLGDPKLLSLLIKKTQHLEGFQVLIPVTKIAEGRAKELGEPLIFDIDARLLERLRRSLYGKPHFSDPRYEQYSTFLGLMASSLDRRKLDGTLGKESSGNLKSRSTASQYSVKGVPAAVPHQEHGMEDLDRIKLALSLAFREPESKNELGTSQSPQSKKMTLRYGVEEYIDKFGRRMSKEEKKQFTQAALRILK